MVDAPTRNGARFGANYSESPASSPTASSKSAALSSVDSRILANCRAATASMGSVMRDISSTTINRYCVTLS